MTFAVRLRGKRSPLLDPDASVSRPIRAAIPSRVATGGDVPAPLSAGTAGCHDRPVAIDASIAAGRAALRAGRWDEARAVFSAALSERETPEALEGMGDALWWLCEARASVRHRERAYVLYRRAGDRLRACRAAVDLSIAYLVNLGNGAASRGWLARAERVMRGADPNPMRGWLWLMQGFLAADPERSRHLLGRALAFAREVEDPDLELVALGDLGLALVAAGEVDEGLELLDEAMAGTMAGEHVRLDTVVFVTCDMLAACSMAGDLERATQWCRVADDFMRTHSSPFLYVRCRLHYGSLLLEKGHWARAEGELHAALRMSEDVGGGARSEALGRLADLRLRQGRVEEAEALLSGLDEPGPPGLVAAVRLARGEAAAAAGLLERRLARRGDEHADVTVELALLVEARIAAGDPRGAGEAAARLEEVARGRGARGPAPALAALSSARVERACGRSEVAVGLLERALELLAGLDLPLEAARARLELARALADRSGPGGGPGGPAVVEARGALAAFEGLGAAADADAAAALLRALGVPGRAVARNPGPLTRRETEVLRLVGLGLSNPEIARRLFISRRTAGHHVSRVLSKLGLRNRAEAAVYALRAFGPPEAERSDEPREPGPGTAESRR